MDRLHSSVAPLRRRRDVGDDVVLQPVLPVEGGGVERRDVDLDVVRGDLLRPPTRAPGRPRSCGRRSGGASRRRSARAADGCAAARTTPPISIESIRGGLPSRSSRTSPSTRPILVSSRSTTCLSRTSRASSRSSVRSFSGFTGRLPSSCPPRSSAGSRRRRGPAPAPASPSSRCSRASRWRACPAACGRSSAAGRGWR